MNKRLKNQANNIKLYLEYRPEKIRKALLIVAIENSWNLQQIQSLRY